MADFDPAPTPDDPEPAPLYSEDIDDPGVELRVEPPHPINWNLLTAEEAEAEWLELNQWVNWLRRAYGLPASVVPPLWHRHPELVWELSALHLHWLSAYDPEQNGSAPLGWHRDFADARQRLRDWTAACGTRLDTDRPTRQTSWPGEDPATSVTDRPITNRDEDFIQFVVDDVTARRQAEDDFYAGLDIDLATGEVSNDDEPRR
ncbi:hypothetical protein IT882_05390 [Microbacterium schleiferi]|uniref:DUF4913 domain-containing protein n=1 Tax=Microbacterium schleiferi TaxID=69362 RepID=A0A7S8MZ99_9MICO|nr:hypothetical protein [Microbacterium schleiferi]QPE05463.1 hypothetical protein IT882_05390 [Microbacterium schleiferi]